EEIRPEELAFLSQALERAIHELFESVASETCLSLFVDDAQWLDPSSLRMITDLLSTRHSAHLFVVLATREQRAIAQSFGNADNLYVVPLRRISDAMLGSLVAEWYSGNHREAGADTQKQIIETARGNPLFAILLARESLEA